MEIELTDEQRFLEEAVAGVVAREASFASVRRWTESGDLGAADDLAVQQGWTGIGLADELGGQGGGVMELAVVAEQLGRGAVPWDRTLAGCLTLPLLADSGTDAAVALAGEIAEGTRSAVLCVDGTAPLAPIDPSVADDERLTLSARYVLGAPAATDLIVPLATDGGVSLLLVKAADSEASISPQPLVDRTRSVAAVELSGPAVTPLGEVDREQLAAAGAAAAVLIAADALGAATRMLDLTTQYVKERRQFGVPVGSFQAVKHAAAEMLVASEASRSAVQYAAWAVDAEQNDLHVHAAIAKAYACHAAVSVADKALFLHGAVGYTWEHDLQFLFKRAKSDELLAGTPDDYLDQIAERVGLLPDPVDIAGAGRARAGS
jgi:alkylation response protein AidB-like acyl-CoA dehydrogenase